MGRSKRATSGRRLPELEGQRQSERRIYPDYHLFSFFAGIDGERNHRDILPLELFHVLLTIAGRYEFIRHRDKDQNRIFSAQIFRNVQNPAIGWL
jgi:hypothetical protein